MYKHVTIYQKQILLQSLFLGLNWKFWLAYAKANVIKEK